MSDTSFPAIETLLPHRDPFLFVQSIRHFSMDRIVCSGSVKQGHYLTIDEEAPPILGVEMGAQVAGVHAALCFREANSHQSPTGVGYLVGIRKAVFHSRSLPVGEPLLVEAIATGTAGPLAMYRILVRGESTTATLVEAGISTWLADDQ